MDIRIIDCHAHLGRFAQAKVGCPDAESILRVMDNAGVEKLCVSSFLGIGPDCLLGNDMVAQAVRAYPDRFVGYATVNPNRPDEIEPELDRCFQKLGMKAIKLHPAFHRYPIEGLSYRRVLEYAGKRRIPILSHDWGRPVFLEQASLEFPDVKFIIAHTGFWDGRTDLPYADVLQQRPNVFVDLVYSNIFYGALERMVAMLGAQKILWGSDFPLHDLPFQLGRVLFAKLDDETKRQILGGNMLRILES
jgi:hypothetical protein